MLISGELIDWQRVKVGERRAAWPASAACACACACALGENEFPLPADLAPLPQIEAPRCRDAFNRPHFVDGHNELGLRPTCSLAAAAAARRKLISSPAAKPSPLAGILGA